MSLNISRKWLVPSITGVLYYTQGIFCHTAKSYSLKGPEEDKTIDGIFPKSLHSTFMSHEN